MRILLVQPTPFEEGRLGLETVIWMSEPVALTAVAAAVPEHEVEILDMRLEDENALPHALRRFKPDLVGTTSMTTDAYQAKAVLRTAKVMFPDVLTVIGGHHPTMSPDEFREPYIDVIVKGEGEITFGELATAWTTRSTSSFDRIDGLEYRTNEGSWAATKKRSQQRSLDSLPAPRRDLIAKYRGGYFFTVARPMASIFTSRGCSFDCNFCAIWEFYDRRTRYLSAEQIADRMAACDEPYIFLLDDNFLTDKKRIQNLVDVLRERKIKKFWMTQGRTDFIADNPELMAELADVGLTCVLSGFESNDDDALAALEKSNTVENNKKASRIMAANGIQSTGIFMVRPDFDKEDFDRLFDYINEMEIAIPIVTILTPLPGTQLERKVQDKLLTRDRRFYDLLHSVLPTKLPRAEFYENFTRQSTATNASVARAFSFQRVMKRKDFWKSVLPNVPRYVWETWRYRNVHHNPESYLRDEVGVLDGRAVTRFRQPVEVKKASGARRLPVLS